MLNTRVSFEMQLVGMAENVRTNCRHQKGSIESDAWATRRARRLRSTNLSCTYQHVTAGGMRV